MMPIKRSGKTRRSERNGSRSLNPFLRDVIKSCRHTLKAVFLFSFIINMLMLAVPIYLLQIYDKVIASRNADTLYVLTGIALIALVAFGFLEALRRGILAKQGAWLEKQLGGHLLSSAIERSQRRDEPSVNVLRDLTRVRAFLSGSALFPILDAPWTPVFLIIMFLLHPYIGALTLFGSLLLVVLAWANEVVTRKDVRESDKRSSHALDMATSYARNADVVKSMGMQRHALANWSEENDNALAMSFSASKRGARLATIAKFTKLLLQIGVIFTAAWLVLQGQLTAGAIIASVLLLRRAISPLEQSIRSWKSFLKARNAFDNINRYLDDAPSLEDKAPMPEPGGTLSAERISYRHSGTDASVFSRLSLRANPGEAIALIGTTAAGKTTLGKILIGITQPSSGRVTLGGFELSQWDSEELGPYVGYLPQDIQLFSGTVRENIARLDDGDIGAVIEAAKLAGVHDIVQRLTDGYETAIGEDGAFLSGGQRQRIALARAVYGNPKLIVLDEPDSNLDTEGREALSRAVEKLKKRGAIVIVITHHKNIHSVVDRVFELKEGRLTMTVTNVPDESKTGASENPKVKSLDRKSSTRKRRG